MSNQYADIQPGLSGFLNGVAVQARVLVALMIRLLMTKYGRSNIGFLWLVAEPMILCCGVLLVRTQIQASEENGVPLIPLLITGYLPLTLWRHISGPGVHLFRRSASLLYHRSISLLDCALAFMFLEIGGCTIAACVVYWTLYTFGYVKPIYDIGLLLTGWFCMAFLAFGLMLCFATLTEFFEAAERFVQPFQYLLLPVCGFFFMVSWLPDSVQKVAWYMPTVHCYEMVRGGFFGPELKTYYTPWYPLLWGLGLMAIALPKVEKAREKIHFG